MSYYNPRNKGIISAEAVLAPGAVVQAEGQALVRSTVAQSEGVFPGTGGANEKFVGFAIARTSAAAFQEAYANKVETFIVPATGSVQLQRAPVSGQILVMDNTAGAVDADATVSDTNVSALTPGNEVAITYKYALSVTEARALYGDMQPGGYAGAEVDQIGVIKAGVVYTSEFDAAVDWAAATGLKVKANGQVTNQAGSGATINGVIVSLPSELVPFLGIEFTAP